MALFTKLLLYSFLMTFVACGAHAHEINVGTGIVCDQQEQVAKYLTLTQGGNPHALQVVNTAAQSTACILAMVAFYRGEPVASLKAEHGRLDIVEILVVGYFDTAWHELKPTIQFTAFFEKEEQI